VSTAIRTQRGHILEREMSLKQRTLKEIKAVGLLTFYFGVWFEIMLFVKRLVLAQYEIEFRGAWLALLGAWVVAKVVIVMEHVSLGRWVRRKPVAVDIALRTLLYTLGVLIVLLLEKAFEARHEAGGLGKALITLFQPRGIDRVWAATICVGGSLLGFNVLSVLYRDFGGAELRRLFFTTSPADLEAKETARSGVATAKELR
jgi:hypothetical protein